MEIRRYRLGEESAVWSVYFAATRESIARDYHPDLIERWAPHDKDLKGWVNRLAQKNPFVAISDGQIVGLAEIDGDGFIDYFYVHPRWQGKGVGKALLATVECEAAKSGARAIFADVSVTAKSFFLSQGFCITEAKSNVILAILHRTSGWKSVFPANQHVQPDPAITSLFHAERPWHGAAEVRRSVITK